tara:strand:- start:19717 stop:20526 length:810 start_codon:yes stop_codon:yes gene_type:complete
MKFALVIPTRGDRPQFIKQCKYLISRQTVQPTEVLWIDYKPESPSKKDITQRYRRGVEAASKKGYEFVVFWEDDDWYHPEYLEWLIKSWKFNKKPTFFGVGETYYYNHLNGAAHHMGHNGRTSAFCTLVKLPWSIPWPSDNYSFLDMHIAKHCKPVTINYDKKIYAVGIKHGFGLTGGGGHNPRFKFNMPNSREWFYNVVGEDRNFYDKTIKPGNPKPKIKPKRPVSNSKPLNSQVIVKNDKPKRRVIANNSSTQQPARRTVVRRLRKR